MTQPASIQGPRATSIPNAPPAGAGTVPPPGSALPPPAGELNLPDALSSLLALQAGVSNAQQALGASDAQAKDAQKQVAEAAREKAVKAAIDAANEAKKHADSGGMFSCITDHIGVVGLIGLCTGQFYLVAEDMAAHYAQQNNNKTSALGVGAALVGGPLGAGLELGLENAMPEDWRTSLDDLGSVKDDDVRVANKVALTVVMAEAMAAATVASGGACAPTYVALAGLAVSTATEVGDETGATQKIFKSDAATASMVGHLTGAALGASAGFASASSAWSYVSASGQALTVLAQAGQETGVTQKLFGDDADKVTIGLTIAGTAAVATGAVGSALSKPDADAAAAKDKADKRIAVAKSAKQIVDGGDNVYRGYEGLVRAGYEHDAAVDNIEAKRQKQLMQRIEMAVDGIIDDMKEAQKSQKRAVETISGAIQTAQQTTLIAIGTKG